jgi:hypothetical protein
MMKKGIKGILVLIILALPGLFIAAIIHNSSNNDIHVVGSKDEAIYIAGEHCGINMWLNREEKDMREEFEDCLRIHKTYVNK